MALRTGSSKIVSVTHRRYYEEEVELAGVLYNSMREATEAVQAILYRYEIGKVVTLKDAEVILDLLDHHPFKKDITGSGIHLVFIGRSLSGHRRFHIYRKDGSSIDFDYKPCIKHCQI